MSGAQKNGLDLEEQLTRMQQMEVSIEAAQQSMTLAIGQFALNVIATFTALGAAVITAYKALTGH